MIKFLLEQLEKAPNPVFSKRELLAISPDDFADLKRRKILTYCRPPEDSMEMVSRPRCQHGCTLTVQKSGGLYEAYCLNHPEEDAILVGEDELYRYRFSLAGLIAQLRSANQFQGEVHPLNGDQFHVGYKVYSTGRVGFIFLLRPFNDHQVRLTGLRELCRDDDLLVIMTPATCVEDVLIKAKLAQHKLVQISLAKTLVSRSFELPLAELIGKLPSPMPAGEPRLTELTQAQAEDFGRFKYQSHDQIHISGEMAKKGLNLVELNGNSIGLGESVFILLLRLAVGAKEEPGGCVSTITLLEEKIINDSESYQPFSRLREKLATGMRDCSPDRLIENDGAKHYRISTHPDFITSNHTRLLLHPNFRVRQLAERLATDVIKHDKKMVASTD